MPLADFVSAARADNALSFPDLPQRPGLGARRWHSADGVPGRGRRWRWWRCWACGRGCAPPCRRPGTWATSPPAADFWDFNGTICCWSAALLAVFLPTHRPAPAGASAVPGRAFQAVLRIRLGEVAIAAARLARRQRHDLLLPDGAVAHRAGLVRPPLAPVVAPVREPRHAGGGAGGALRHLRSAQGALRWPPFSSPVFQLINAATANYGFFCYLSVALHLFLLDDAQIQAAVDGARVRFRSPCPGCIRASGHGFDGRRARHSVGRRRRPEGATNGKRRA